MYQRKLKRFINERVKRNTSRTTRLYYLVKYCCDIQPSIGYASRYFAFDLSESSEMITDFDRDVRDALGFIDTSPVPDDVIEKLKALQKKYKGQ